ncbi:MAG: MarR family transcriptional regulator [Salinarimonadaceae bacterium]|nr:MAG: MarR family transcriptional regulator [Salinarimonadaceae bacterium]
MASFPPVRAIIRGLEILRTVSQEGPISAGAIARRTDLPQPTVIRILETLIQSGYLYRDPDSVTYGVTARTLALSIGYNSSSRLVQIAQPLIEELRAEIGWPSNLAIFEQDAMVIAYTNRAAKGLQMPGRLGARIPLLATGVGVIFLANQDPGERDAILARLRRSGERWDQEPSLWSGLEERLTEARRRGFAFADEGYLDAVYQSRIWAVAVPIGFEGGTVAALSSLVLRTTGPQKRILTQILPALRRTASAIEDRLMADAGSVDAGSGADSRRSGP